MAKMTGMGTDIIFLQKAKHETPAGPEASVHRPAPACPELIESRVRSSYRFGVVMPTRRKTAKL